MALPSTRCEYRVQLSDVEREVQRELSVVAARHPSETAEHLTLRVLAFCLLWRDSIAFGPGLSDGEGPDLEAHDAGGRRSLWVECGAVEAAKLKRVVQQHPGAEVHVVLADRRRRRELLEAVAALPHGIKGGERVTLWQLGPELLAALAGNEARRQRWSVTVVGGHLYVDADGRSFDGQAAAEPLPDGAR